MEEALPNHQKILEMPDPDVGRTDVDVDDTHATESSDGDTISVLSEAESRKTSVVTPDGPPNKRLKGPAPPTLVFQSPETVPSPPQQQQPQPVSSPSKRLASPVSEPIPPDYEEPTTFSPIYDNVAQKPSTPPPSVTVNVTSPVVQVCQDAKPPATLQQTEQLSINFDGCESSTDDSLPYETQANPPVERFVSVVSVVNVTEDKAETDEESQMIGQKLDESEVLILNTSSVVSNGVPLEIESKNNDNNETPQTVKPDEPEQKSNEAADEQDGRQNNNNAVLESRSDVSCNLSQVSSLSRSSSGSDRSSLSESREDTSVIHISFTVEGTTQEATDDDSFVQSDVVSSSEIVPALPPKERSTPKERSRSPSPQIEKTDPVKEVEEEEEDDESILSPNRKVKGDASGDSGSGTGGTSIPSTPDSVFLERTLDFSDIESTSGTGTMGSRCSRNNDSVIDVEVVTHSMPSSGRSLSTVSIGTTINSSTVPASFIPSVSGQHYGSSFACSASSSTVVVYRNPCTLRTYPTRKLILKKRYEVLITNMPDGPFLFYLQLKKENQNHLKLRKLINSVALTSFVGEPKPGMVCLALFPHDNLIYRGTIMAISHFGGNCVCIVNFVDIGIEAPVELDLIYEIPQMMLNLDVLAYRASLFGIEDAAKNLVKLNDAFISLVKSSPNLVAEVEEVGPTGIPNIFLHDKNGRSILDSLNSQFNNKISLPHVRHATNPVRVSQIDHAKISGEECLFIVSAEEEGFFFGHLEESEDSWFGDVIGELKLVYSSIRNPPLMHLSFNKCLNLYGVAKYANSFFRVQVVKEIGLRFVVLLVDYGTQVTVNCSEIFAPVAGLIHFKRPSFGIRCRLKGVYLANKEEWKNVMMFKTIKVGTGELWKGALCVELSDHFMNSEVKRQLFAIRYVLDESEDESIYF